MSYSDFKLTGAGDKLGCLQVVPALSPLSPAGLLAANWLMPCPLLRWSSCHRFVTSVVTGGRLQQLQLYVSAETRISGDKYHLSPRPVSVYYTPRYTLDINLITNFRRPPFTVLSIWVELSSPSYLELAVPDDPRQSSPPDAKVGVLLV
jgi:hypothetical protein